MSLDNKTYPLPPDISVEDLRILQELKDRYHLPQNTEMPVDELFFIPEDASPQDRAILLQLRDRYAKQKTVETTTSSNRPTESPAEAHMRRYRESQRRALEGNQYPLDGTDSGNFDALRQLDDLYKRR